MNAKIHKMKVMAFFAALIGVLYGCSSSSFRSPGQWYTQGGYMPGVYEGTASGFRGRIRVAVRIDENGIAEIELDHEDDREIGGAAMEEVLELVLEGNSTDGIDAVSGATESSLGFLAAVDTALSKAVSENGPPPEDR